MLKVDMALKREELLACSLANTAGPAACPADDHSVAILLATFLLMHLKEALAIKGLVAERALWVFSSLALRGLLEYGAEHGRILELILGVIIDFIEVRFVGSTALERDILTNV